MTRKITRAIRRECRNCGGDGFVKGGDCPACNGEGYVTEFVTTVRDECPRPEQIIRERTRANLSREQAARFVKKSGRTWEAWEQGRSKMDAGLWELFLLKVGELRGAS